LEPSGENATALTVESTVNVDTQSPVFVFQSLTVPSSLPLAKIVEFGLQATELTLRLR
jgi:hypothetical protein